MNDDDFIIKKHSVILSGHRTSVSLENLFWSELRWFAEIDGSSISRLIEKIDSTREGNLSSAIRVYVVRRLKHF
ncbi:MAG: aryl-sulfate sulfotransferase [Rhodospirillaceae bacterium TMED8]|nr:aryl-sulfate sulfotransferase [Magnetovibrio sp.]OUT48963.1 MAG: aryl-sulfate sulfotransferase [Rhodospirillaceae bacterium TMED8]